MYCFRVSLVITIRPSSWCSEAVRFTEGGLIYKEVKRRRDKERRRDHIHEERKITITSISPSSVPVSDCFGTMTCAVGSFGHPVQTPEPSAPLLPADTWVALGE